MKVNGKCRSIWRNSSTENIKSLFKASLKSIFGLGSRTRLEATSVHISVSMWGYLEQVALEVHFGNRRPAWKYVFLSGRQARVDPRRNEATQAFTCLWVAGKDEYPLICSPALLFLYLAAEPESSLQHFAFGDFPQLCHIPWWNSECWNRWGDYREPQTSFSLWSIWDWCCIDNNLSFTCRF